MKEDSRSLDYSSYWGSIGIMKKEWKLLFRVLGLGFRASDQRLEPLIKHGALPCASLEHMRQSGFVALCCPEFEELDFNP